MAKWTFSVTIRYNDPYPKEYPWAGVATNFHTAVSSAYKHFMKMAKPKHRQDDIKFTVIKTGKSISEEVIGYDKPTVHI